MGDVRAFAYPPRRLSAPEAARYIGVSETTLRALDFLGQVAGVPQIAEGFDQRVIAGRLHPP